MLDRICAICGAKKATTVDHVPPKGIFPKPRPDLITVPACLSCNNSASKHDEAFRVFLSLHVGITSPLTQSLWNDALKSLKHNYKLYSDIMNTTKKVVLHTKTSNINNTGMAFCWNSEAHDRTIERMIRGLYFYHFDEILANRVIIKVQWLRSLNEDIFEVSKEWKQHNLSGNSFVYRFERAIESPLYSIWLFQFYNKHWASGYTMPVVPDNMLKY